MMSQARTALLSSLPAFRAACFSTLRASTVHRRLPTLLHAAGHDAFSSQASAAGAASQSERSVTTTMSRCAAETVRGSHVFKINGYSLLRGLGVGHCIQSTTFCVGGHNWRIQFFPDGRTEEDDDKFGSGRFYSDDDSDEDEYYEFDDEGHVSVFVTLMSKDSNVRALCDLSLVNPATGQPEYVRSGRNMPKVFDGEGASFGFGRFKKRRDLVDSVFLRDDSLQIQCDIKVVTGARVLQSTKTLCDVPVLPSNLLEDIGKFLDEDQKAHVTFKVQGEVFHANKSFLAMRSPFFNAVLNNGARDGGVSKRQCITIEDMEPAVFKALLHYIYTDSLPAMDDLDGDKKEERVKSLLAAADRCGMERMKLMCASILCKGLKAENVATTLALADQLHCSHLKDACVGFINSTDRLDDVLASPGYEQLKVASPATIVELWEKSAESSGKF